MADLINVDHHAPIEAAMSGVHVIFRQIRISHQIGIRHYVSQYLPLNPSTLHPINIGS